MKRAFMTRVGWVLLSAPLGCAHAVDALHVETNEPRAYGYQVGEVMQRQVTVLAPMGWRLAEDSLPRPGGRGQAIELRRVAASVHAVPGGQRHELALEYQVFLAPANVRVLEIAPLRLRFEHATRSEGRPQADDIRRPPPVGVEDTSGGRAFPQEVRVEGWPVTVAPLTPLEASTRRGLGDLQPDRSPPLVDTATIRIRLLGCAVLGLLLLSALATVVFGPPWRAARNRPFARAWRELRHLPNPPGPLQWRAACRALHEALNGCAGEVLFEPGLDRFVTAHPSFGALRGEIARFMQMSRDEFFGDTAGADDRRARADDNGARAERDAAWLVNLCRRCRDAERGFAQSP
jgi:mxaA protein